MISPNDGAESRYSSKTLESLVSRTFEPSGWLQTVMDLEHRPEQAKMARAVSESMSQDSPLIFEAGTGVGKSLAYLVPGIIHSSESKRPCIVSSNTISLQEQIEEKDLAICRRLFAAIPELEPYSKFNSVVLVGKGNYLCPTRLANAIANKTELFPNDELDELQRIQKWSVSTETGLRQELDPVPNFDVWDLVNAEGSACNRKNCDPRSCYYQKSRIEMRKAQVVVVNHSLLFALINAGGLAPNAKGILLPDDFLVIDEAHTSADVATEHFGSRISSYGLDRQLKSLFNPKRKSGVIRKWCHPKQLQQIVDAQEASQEFFSYLAATRLEKRPVARVSEPDWTDAPLLHPLKAVVQIMDTVLSRIEDGPMHDEIKDQRARIHGYFSGIRQFVDLAEEDHVHWIERSGRRKQIVTLRTAPVNVAPYLKDTLFSEDRSVVLTSATLSIAKDLYPFQKRIGAEGERAELVESPFDYENNTRIYVASDIPPQSPENSKQTIEAIIDYLWFCIEKNAGGSLALFTSYSDLRKAGDALEDRIIRSGREFFSQGNGLSRSEIANRFRKSGNGVLFGTDSFWTGVDVPGNSLSQVIITKLPFDVPTHPITEAKSEFIKEHGGNPFGDLTLPDALIKFRQGIGRLIRKKDDKGIITILDSRILSKAYGKRFLQSLPKRKFIRMSKSDRETRFCNMNVTLPPLHRRFPSSS